MREASVSKAGCTPCQRTRLQMRPRPKMRIKILFTTGQVRWAAGGGPRCMKLARYCMRLVLEFDFRQEAYLIRTRRFKLRGGRLTFAAPYVVMDFLPSPFEYSSLQTSS